MHPLTLALTLSLALLLAPSSSLALSNPTIATHTNPHLKPRRPISPPPPHPEAPNARTPPVPAADAHTDSERQRRSETEGEGAYEFDSTWEDGLAYDDHHSSPPIPAPPAAGVDGEARSPDGEGERKAEGEKQKLTEDEENKKKEKEKEKKKHKKKPKKSLYTWPLLKTDVLHCCPKYAYNCADRKAICHDGQKAKVD